MLIFALGSGLAMLMMFRLMAESIRDRGDSRLAAEVRSLASDAAADHDLDLEEDLRLKLRELLRHEFPASMEKEDRLQSLAFFAQISSDDKILKFSCEGATETMRDVVSKLRGLGPGVLWLEVPGWEYPLRLAVAGHLEGKIFVAGVTPVADLELLEDVRDAALNAWILLLIIGFWLSWLSTRRVLARVDRLAEAASKMEAGKPGERLPVEGNRDEIGRMAVAFNGLLERNEEGVDHLRSMAEAFAHDIRSPLTTIRASLESALGDKGSRDGEIEEALAGIDRLKGIIDSSLDVSEAEAGVLRVAREELDLRAIAAELVDLYGALAAEKNIEITLESPPRLDYSGDPQLLRRALSNLLDNALAHLPQASTARLRLDRGADGVILEVEDTGPGFPPEISGSVFDRWVKGPGSRGSGLGLAVVRAVALAHGGYAELRSAKGGGSIVRLVLR